MVWLKIPVFVVTITNIIGPTSSEKKCQFWSPQKWLEKSFILLQIHLALKCPQVNLWFCWVDFDFSGSDSHWSLHYPQCMQSHAASSGAKKDFILCLKTSELILSGVWSQVSAAAVPVDDQRQHPVRTLHQTDGLLTGAAEGHGVNAHQLITNLETHCCRHAALLHLDTHTHTHTHTHTNITTKSPSSVEEEEGEEVVASLFI